MKKTSIRNYFLLLLTAFIWGSAFVAQSVAADNIPAFTFLGLRNILATLVLIPIILAMRKFGKAKTESAGEMTVTKEEKRKSTVVGGIVCGIFLCAASATQQIGIPSTTPGKAGFITALYVILVPILRVIFRKKTNPLIFISVILSALGLYLLCMQDDSFSLSGGECLLLLCALLYSFHIMAIDHFIDRADAVSMSCIQFFVCGVISLVIMAIFEHPTWEGLKAGWFPLVYAGVFSSAIAYTLQVVGQKNVNPTIAVMILCLESVFAVLTGWVIRGDALSIREGIGCALMLGAIVLAQLLPEEFHKRNNDQNIEI